MTRKIGVGISAGAILAGAWLFMAEAALGQQKGKTRPAATKFLMRGISKPHCQGLETLLKDAGPADDKAWETAQCHASCVNEVSFLLMDDGRCPDKTWADAAKSLRAGAQSTLEAAEKKDLEGARKGFQMVKDACAACHKAHKKSQ